jgi:hypothetical protein
MGFGQSAVWLVRACSRGVCLLVRFKLYGVGNAMVRSDAVRGTARERSVANAIVAPAAPVAAGTSVAGCLNAP